MTNVIKRKEIWTNLKHRVFLRDELEQTQKQQQMQKSSNVT